MLPRALFQFDEHNVVLAHGHIPPKRPVGRDRDRANGQAIGARPQIRHHQSEQHDLEFTLENRFPMRDSFDVNDAGR
jgi:hypothetical protein